MGVGSTSSMGTSMLSGVLWAEGETVTLSRLRRNFLHIFIPLLLTRADQMTKNDMLSKLAYHKFYQF